MSIKGIILAGGLGTRLYPLTRVTNKHLLPVGSKPMIFHQVEQLVAAGIQDILIVTSTGHMGDIVQNLGSGLEFGCDFTYRVQEKPQGVAHALHLARRFSENQPLAVLLGDNIFGGSLTPYIEAFLKQPTQAQVLLKEVADPRAYGVAQLANNKILKIVEKPSEIISPYAVVGFYCYPTDVFDVICSIDKSARGEYEITPVNNHYIQTNRMNYHVLNMPWTDAGSFESLYAATQIVSGLASEQL